MRVLVITRTQASGSWVSQSGGLISDEIVDQGDYLLVTGIAAPLYGERFDVIVLPKDDTNPRYGEWVDLAVRCRLAPGGKMIYT